LLFENLGDIKTQIQDLYWFDLNIAYPNLIGGLALTTSIN